MAHSLHQVYVHLVFAVQDRVPVLADRDVRGDWHGYMTGICRNVGCPSLQIGGVEDHVHALCRLSRELTMDQLAEALQEGAADWLRTRHRVTDFHWQDGYGAFSVSRQNVEGVIRFVRNQERHHQEETFEEEYRRIRQRCGGSEDEVNIHLVFSTKNLIPHLMDPEVRQSLHGQIEDLFTDAGCPCLRVGGIEDHVHGLCRLSRNKMTSRVVRRVKKKASTWLGKQFGMWDFGWQEGYGAFSVSPQHVEMVTRYIENQEEHHRSWRFYGNDPWQGSFPNPKAQDKR